jgi:hypothetical protein
MKTEPTDGTEARELAAKLGANGPQRVTAERFKARMREMDAAEREPLLAGALSHYALAVGRALAQRNDAAARRACVMALLHDAAYDELVDEAAGSAE